MAERDEPARLAREVKGAVLIHVAIGKESRDLVAADRIAQVEVGAQVVFAARGNDAGQGNGPAPSAARGGGRGCRIDMDVAREQAGRVGAAAAAELHARSKIRRVVAVGSKRDRAPGHCQD